MEVPVSQDKKLKNVEEAEKARLSSLRRDLQLEESSSTQ